MRIFEEPNQLMRDQTLKITKDGQILARYNHLFFNELMREKEIYKKMEIEFYLKPKTLYKIVLRMSRSAQEAEDRQLLTA